jgi:mRNA interferase HigB
LRVISKKKLREFWAIHPAATQPLSLWYKAAEHAEWSSPNDVRNTYRRADPIGGEFVVFDICNDEYRLVVKVDYRRRRVYVWKVLTHKEYDAIDFKELIKEDLRERNAASPKRRERS